MDQQVEGAAPPIETMLAELTALGGYVGAIYQAKPWGAGPEGRPSRPDKNWSVMLGVAGPRPGTPPRASALAWGDTLAEGLGLALARLRQNLSEAESSNQVAAPDLSVDILDL